MSDPTGVPQAVAPDGDGLGDGAPRSSGTKSLSPNRSTGGRKRVRNFTADDRAAHRVFERSRREAFKHRLIVSLLRAWHK